MRILVAYDISSDRTRALAADLLVDVIPRVQRSVFEGNAPEEAHRRCLAKILELMDPQTDSVRVYRLCADCARRVEAYGQEVVLDTPPVRVL